MHASFHFYVSNENGVWGSGPFRIMSDRTRNRLSPGGWHYYVSPSKGVSNINSSSSRHSWWQVNPRDPSKRNSTASLHYIVDVEPKLKVTLLNSHSQSQNPNPKPKSKGKSWEPEKKHSAQRLSSQSHLYSVKKYLVTSVIIREWFRRILWATSSQTSRNYFYFQLPFKNWSDATAGRYIRE